MSEHIAVPLAIRWGRRLQPTWSRERVFEPALHDVLSQTRGGGAPRSAKVLLLLLQCWQIAIVEVWRLWRGRTTLAHRRLEFGGGSSGAGGQRSDLPPARPPHPLESWIQDARFAWRALMSRRGFTLAVVLVLALGIGANTTVFTILDKVVLRPLDFPEPDRLIFLTETARVDGVETPANVTAGGFRTWRERSELIGEMAALHAATLNLTTDDRTHQLDGLWVSGTFFDVLGQPPALGPGFSPVVDRTEREIVVSHGIWQDRFAGGDQVIGSELYFDEEPYRIVGVAVEGFTFGSDVDVWLAAERDIPRPPISDGGDYTASFGLGYLGVVGRIAPEATYSQVVEEMDAISAAISEEQPVDQSDRGVLVRPLHEYAVGDVRAPLGGLVGAVALVLLIACANIASLLLVRASARRRELGIREAMGASRGRLFRLLLVESLVLSILGGVVGIVLAAVSAEFVVALLPELPRTIDLTPDFRILAFSLGVTAVCGLLFGTAPAWQAARADVRGVLGSTRTTEGVGARRTRSLLVVAEIGLALVLVVGAGLMLKSFSRLIAAEPGFDPTNLVAVSLALPEARYDNSPEIGQFFATSLEAIQSHPEVESAGVVLATPFSGSAARMDVFVADEQPDDTLDQRAVFQVSTPGYFQTMRIPLNRGRDFTEADNSDGAPAVIVNEEFVRRRLPPNVDPLEVSLHFGDFDPVPIVGVVGSVLHLGYGGDVPSEVYIPQQQMPWRFGTFMVRGHESDTNLAGIVEDAVADVDSLQPTGGGRSMEDVIYGSVQQPRFVTTLLGVFAGSALLLAAIGLFGLISFSVGQRNQEIGVRMALGAGGAAVLRMILRQALSLVGFGVALGVAAGAALSQLLASQLYDVNPTDPVVYLTAVVVLSSAAILAAWLPARRATRIDPVRALRQD